MNVKVLTLQGEDIPEKLRHIADAPDTLYVRGNGNVADLFRRPAVAIVGSRKVDAYGMHVTKLLASELAAKGVVVVSGLALGTDAIAHQACLSAGSPTIALLASGIDNITPKTNVGVAHNILTSGLIISEHEGEYSPHKHDFLIRNRLISGLADAVIIPQASARSGSLNTARHALEQGRTVMAVPGSITNPLCEGPNNLIKMGATPVTCTQDVLHALGLDTLNTTRAHELLAENQAELDIIKTLQDGITDGEEILRLTKLKVSELNTHLTMLEIRGIIAPTGGNHWQLI